MPKEKIEYRQVILDECPAEELAQSAEHLYQELLLKAGEPPSMKMAFTVGLLTGVVSLMDKLGLPHDYKEFSLIVDMEKLDS
jgi:hypothetical protein